MVDPEIMNKLHIKFISVASIIVGIPADLNICAVMGSSILFPLHDPQPMPLQIYSLYILNLGQALSQCCLLYIRPRERYILLQQPWRREMWRCRLTFLESVHIPQCTGQPSVIPQKFKHFAEP